MKKLFILLTICIGMAVGANAQTIDSTGFYHMVSVNGPTNSLVVTAAPKPGLTPSDTFLPCATRGMAVLDTIIFTNYDSVNGGTGVGMVPLQSLTIDSIYLPSGLTWSTNSATNSFAGGAGGAIVVTGTTYDTAGQYKLRITVTAHVLVGGVLPVTKGPLDAEANTGLAYRVRVVNSGCGCPTIDNSSRDSVRVFIPYATCAPSCPTITVTTTKLSSSSASASASGGATPYTYAWSTSPSQTTATATGLTVGTNYTVTATDNNGCTGIGSITILGVGSLGDISGFNIYPNPSNCEFVASVHLAAASDVTITIIDMTGQKVYEGTENAVKDLNKQINLGSISSGMYFVNVRTAQGTANQRIIIK